MLLGWERGRRRRRQGRNLIACDGCGLGNSSAVELDLEGSFECCRVPGDKGDLLNNHFVSYRQRRKRRSA